VRGGLVTRAVWLVALWALPGGVGGQTATVPNEPSRGMSWTAVGVSAAVFAVSLPLDESIRSWVQGDPRQGSTVLRRGTDLLTPWGSWAPIVVGAGLLGAAEALDRPKLADAVWHTGEGTVAASAIAFVLKVAVHRTRPYDAPDDPGTFFEGPLFPTKSSRQSFPSGHSAVAFGLAAAASEEAGIHWPGHARRVSIALYGMATGVAFARIYRDVHWTSDVVAGAALGMLVSRAVVARAHPGGSAEAGPPPLSVMLLPAGRAWVGYRLALP